MILSDKTIKKYLNAGQIIIKPALDARDIRPVGIRLHLGKGLVIPLKNQVIDPSQTKPIKFKLLTIPTAGYRLKSNHFVLGTTKESIYLPTRTLIGYVDGRSTIARVGLTIHCTSAIADGHYEGPHTITLEIKNYAPYDIILKVNLPIGMLRFMELSTPIEQKLQSQYKGQTSVLPPNLQFQPDKS